jgi:hypothetical protein
MLRIRNNIADPIRQWQFGCYAGMAGSA